MGCSPRCAAWTNTAPHGSRASCTRPRQPARPPFAAFLNGRMQCLYLRRRPFAVWRKAISKPIPPIARGFKDSNPTEPSMRLALALYRAGSMSEWTRRDCLATRPLAPRSTCECIKTAKAAKQRRADQYAVIVIPGLAAVAQADLAVRRRTFRRQRPSQGARGRDKTTRYQWPGSRRTARQASRAVEHPEQLDVLCV